MKEPVYEFYHFLEKFPELELPVTLTSETHHVFSRQNDQLPFSMANQIIEKIEGDKADEFTEIVPCFRIPETIDFHAVVYWKAGLLQYEYTLATFTKKGTLINKQVIAGTKAEGNLLAQSVATIDEDWTIHVLGGIGSTNQNDTYDGSSSQSIRLELLTNGQIITSP